LASFSSVSQIYLDQEFVSQYPVSLVSGVQYYQGELFIARHVLPWAFPVPFSPTLPTGQLRWTDKTFLRS
jgi:hypothetical protein